MGTGRLASISAKGSLVGLFALTLGLVAAPEAANAGACSLSDELVLGTQSAFLCEGTPEDTTNKISLSQDFTATNASTGIDLKEPNTSPQLISDNVHLTISGNVLTVTLTSDTDTASVPPTEDAAIFEDGSTTGFPVDSSGFIDLTAFFDLTTPGLPTIKVESDGEATPTPTPEPSSLALLGAALSGLALVRRRRRKAV